MNDKPALTVRGAAERDAPSIYGLIEANAGGGQVLSVPEAKIRSKAGEYLVAEIDGLPVGCGRLHDWGRGVLELCSLSVRADRQGKGIGAALVRGLLGRAAAGSFVILGTDKPAFYERFGFIAIPRRRIPLFVWIGKTGALFEQSLRTWPALMATKYEFMAFARTSFD